MQGSHHQCGAPLASLNGDPGHFLHLHQQGLALGGRDEAHRHADDQCRAGTLLADHPHQLDERGGRIADGDDLPIDEAQPLRLAHGLHGTGAVLGLGLLDDVLVGNELVGLNAEMRQSRCGKPHADHLHVCHDMGAALGTRIQQQLAAGTHRIRVETGQAIEIEVGIGVDHAPHDRPLLGRVGMRTGFAVDDGEAVMLDDLPGAGQLLGDGVDGAHGFWRSGMSKMKGWCADDGESADTQRPKRERGKKGRPGRPG